MESAVSHRDCSSPLHMSREEMSWLHSVSLAVRTLKGEFHETRSSWAGRTQGPLDVVRVRPSLKMECFQAPRCLRTNEAFYYKCTFFRPRHERCGFTGVGACLSPKHPSEPSLPGGRCRVLWGRTGLLGPPATESAEVIWDIGQRGSYSDSLMMSCMSL